MVDGVAAATRRLFFALWPDDDVAAALAAVVRAEHARCGGRAMRRDTLHLTLAFLGDVAAERVGAAETAADGVRGAVFDLTLDRLGYWRHNRIRWAGCAAPQQPLSALAAELAARLRAADFALERRAFAAHVTLLRNAEGGDESALSPPLVWHAGDFALVESYRDGAGARYRVLRRWPLAAA